MNEDHRPEHSEEDADAHGKVVDVERVIRLLTTGHVCEEHGRMRWSSNYTTVISVQDDQIETLAVYKPRQGERPLWDFPHGSLCLREVAAYQVSQALGWGLVAPTVLREGPKGIGSVQLFIEHDPEINYFSLSDDFIPQLQMMAAFDALVNNTDRKGGHCLVDPRGKLWGIDHGICFHALPKLRTVIWDFAGDPLPELLLNDLRRTVDDLCNKGELFAQLEALLSRAEIEAMRE
ncbi:MAG: SCO1664 family protein, partial [Chloroflexi bacterium]|nr:SCO1664 family protein [Chloroflexota bacterium]